MADQTLFTSNVENDIIDLDLSVIKKKRFRINKDDDRILELNTSDMNILTRISEAYPKLQALQDKASKLMDGVEVNEESADFGKDMKTVSDRLIEVDTEMRNLIDFMFDANVSELTAPDGSMYDPFNGTFRFDHIIVLLMNQYETNLKEEFDKMDKQLSKHTAKYTAK